MLWEHNTISEVVLCAAAGVVAWRSPPWVHTAHIPTAASSVLSKQRVRRWLKKLWGNTLANNLALKESTVTHCFSRHNVGEGFHLLPHSKFMLLKHIMDHFSQSLGSTGDIWPRSHTVVCLVFGSRVAFYHQSGWCLLQVAGLTGAKSICQLKTTGVLGASGLPFGRRAK